MIRALGICLLLAVTSSGQRQAPPPATLTFDATVTGNDGRAIAGLTAKDFELTHSGATREITSVTWITGSRTIIVVVDDLGLTPERVATRQDTLRTFIGQLAPDDRVAIVRASSGAGWLEPISTDRRPLRDQIDRIQPVAHGITDAMAANAIAQAIRWAMDSAQAVEGRKAIALLAEPAHIAALRRNESLTYAAHRTMSVFYFVDSRSAPPALDLAADTGGAAVPDLGSVLGDQEGYYTIAFHPANDGMENIPPILKVRGKIANVRWRAALLGQAPQSRITAGGDLHVDLSALLVGYNNSVALVDVFVHIDGHDISTLRDLKGLRHGSAEIQVVPYSFGGQAPGSLGRTVDLDLDDAHYEQLQSGGTQLSARITVPGAGGYQIRTIVSDGRSGRMGSAMQFLDIPAADRGALAISGIMLANPETSDAAKPEPVTQQALRALAVYRPASVIQFVYGIFNATLGAEKQSRVQVQTRIYAGGKMTFQGSPTVLEFPPATGTVRQVSSKISLDSKISPGHYVVEVEVADLLAKEGAPRVATQYRTFDVQE